MTTDGQRREEKEGGGRLKLTQGGHRVAGGGDALLLPGSWRVSVHLEEILGQDDGIGAAKGQSHRLEGKRGRKQPAGTREGLLEIDGLGSGAVGEVGGKLEIDRHGRQGHEETQGPEDHAEADGAGILEDGGCCGTSQQDESVSRQSRRTC